MTTPTLRPLTEAEHLSFTAARMLALEHVPYFAHALFSMAPLAAVGLGTFAVDAAWRLYLDPETMDAWGPELSAAVLAHEVSHLVRDHAGRAQALGQVHHEVWNIATDAAVNDDLLDAGVALPEGVVTPANQGLPANGIEEDYYHLLVQSTATRATANYSGCGSGAGDPDPAWQAGAPVPAGASPAQQRIARQRVATDIASRTAGSVPAGLRRWADEVLTGPKVSWRVLLAGAVRRAAALTVGRTTYTYARPGRRRLPGLLTPAMRSPKITAAIVIDTSGSMSADDLAAALAETTGIIKATGGHTTVLTCDVDASGATRVRRASDIELTGGGGTDMRVGIAAAAKLRPRPDITVVLTDGYTPWPTAPISQRLIIAMIGQDPPLGQAPPWAVTVHVAD